MLLSPKKIIRAAASTAQMQVAGRTRRSRAFSKPQRRGQNLLTSVLPKDFFQTILGNDLQFSCIWERSTNDVTKSVPMLPRLVIFHGCREQAMALSPSSFF